MVDDTYTKTNIECIKEAIAKLTFNQLTFTNTQNLMTSNIDKILHKYPTLNLQSPLPLSIRPIATQLFPTKSLKSLNTMKPLTLRALRRFVLHGGSNFGLVPLDIS